ncbi:hypothetical protein Tco_0902306 [Tanacetum coccineum]
MCPFKVPYLENPSSDLIDMCSYQVLVPEHPSSDLMDMCSYQVPYLEHLSSDLMDMYSYQMPYLEHLSSDLMDMCSYQMPYLEHPSSDKFVHEHVMTSNNVTFIGTFIPLIMEYLVKISKKARIVELKQRHLKITVLTSNMSYPSRKIWRICACTSLKTTKEQDSICDHWDQRVRSQLIGKDLVGGLLVYELRLSSLRKKYRLNLKNDMPPRDNITVNGKNAYELKGKFLDDLHNNAFSGAYGGSDLEDECSSDVDETTKIFKIETDIFDYKAPLCTKLNEFNYLLKIDPELFTYDVEGIKTYDDYMNKFDEELAEPWGMMEYLTKLVIIFANLFVSKMGKLNGPLAIQMMMDFAMETFRNFHELDYELLEKLQDYWWKVNDHECPPVTNWRNYIRGPYANYYSNILDIKDHEDEKNT